MGFSSRRENYSMAKEPLLTFQFSSPNKFHCSFCRDVGVEGAFSFRDTIEELIQEFKEHVEKWHSKGEDFRGTS